MAFDKTLPNNATKIRDYPGILTGNISAVQQGDADFNNWSVNLINRVTAGQTADAVRIASTMRLYASPDQGTAPSGKTELFVISAVTPSGVVIQLTNNGKLGAEKTSIQAKDISFGTNNTVNDQRAMASAWSTVTVPASSITAQTNYGMTWARASEGKYVATFTVAMDNADYSIVGTGSSTDVRSVMVNPDVTKDVNGFGIVTRNTNAAARDSSFNVVVFGGR